MDYNDPSDLSRLVSTDPWNPEADMLREDTDQEINVYIDIDEQNRVGIFPMIDGEVIAFGEGRFNFPRGPYNSAADASKYLEDIVNEVSIIENTLLERGNAMSQVAGTVGNTKPTPPSVMQSVGDDETEKEEPPQNEDFKSRMDSVRKNLENARNEATGARDMARVAGNEQVIDNIESQITTVLKNVLALRNKYDLGTPYTGEETT
jgi:hypothetical protein